MARRFQKRSLFAYKSHSKFFEGFERIKKNGAPVGEFYKRASSKFPTRVIHKSILCRLYRRWLLIKTARKVGSHRQLLAIGHLTTGVCCKTLQWTWNRTKRLFGNMASHHSQTLGYKLPSQKVSSQTVMSYRQF